MKLFLSISFSFPVFKKNKVLDVKRYFSLFFLWEFWGCLYCFCLFRAMWRNWYGFCLLTEEICGSILFSQNSWKFLCILYILFWGNICKTGDAWEEGSSVACCVLRPKLICFHSDNLTQPSDWCFQSGLLYSSPGGEEILGLVFLCVKGVI